MSNNQQLQDRLLAIDNEKVWHPYSAIGADLPVYAVASAQGVRLKLMDGRELIDGMSSWWSAIHGYNHPQLNAAVANQLQDMAHVMFGGLTHRPAIELAELLIELTPSGLQSVFFSDSGSVAVEVAMKMAIQYWRTQNKTSKNRFLSLRNAYHGDTFGAMSVCDPVNGMHSLFSGTMITQMFVDAPQCRFGESVCQPDRQALLQMLQENHQHIAALIVEPIVQGAGGMRFYSADYLKMARELSRQFDVLLITDEIATGFGRTGTLFACEHAGIEPDILCLGKALTGGYMTLAATLCKRHIAESISQGEPGLFMHGPTFMANPMACSVAIASISLLQQSHWQNNVMRIEQGLREKLAICNELPNVAEVRVLGAIGVVELKETVDMLKLQPMFVEQGVWVRPFNKLVYIMPPYIMQDDDLGALCRAIYLVLQNYSNK